MPQKTKKTHIYKKIKKRNGRIVPFKKEKIALAIGKAGAATGEFEMGKAEELSERVLWLTRDRIDGAIPEVEQIQDFVEEILLASPYKKTAKAYILYRDQHKKIREIANTATVDLVDQYLGKLDWQVKENSNMAYSLQGLNNYVSSEISKIYWLNKIYPEAIRDAHINGEFHLHDLNILSVYCVGWDLYDLLMEGFTGVGGKIECAPPKHFRSALGQAVNFFYTLQGESAGAQAFSNFDTLLAPFIRYDKLTYKEVKQHLQSFLFNMNVSTRVGFQTPFTNVTLDLNVPKYFKNQKVIIGGKPQKENYGDFQEEIDMFNRAFLEVMSEGDAKGRVFTFPIPTYNITKDFDWENKNISLLWEVTAKYGLPYFSNFINSDMSPEDARSMCCRLRIDNRQLEHRGGGLFGANPLTGSIGVVTINLPRIGYNSKTKKQFVTSLKKLMILAKESLEIKRKVLENMADNNLYPYTKFYLRKIKEGFGCYWRNHFSTIGIVGMNEAIENLLGKNIGTQEGKEFAEEVLDFMRKTLVAFQKETGNNYNLEATPAEGTSHRLALIDKKKCDGMIFANGKGKETEHPFYTNSTHLPVNFTSDMFELLDLQDGLQTKYTGGTAIHFFLGEKVSNSDSLKNLVKKVCENYHIPYFTFTPSFSVCRNHGYISGENPTCPECGEGCEIYSRIVGYLRPISQWNDGKKSEFDMRKKFEVEPISEIASGLTPKMIASE
ncbi:MAG: ribonucleoside triphosphate reductase [Candidatus Zambryskibacteria bacterium]